MCCLDVRGAMPGSCWAMGSHQGSPGWLWVSHSHGCRCQGGQTGTLRLGLGHGGREVLESASEPPKQKHVGLQRVGGSQHGCGTMLLPDSLASPAAPSPCFFFCVGA